MSNNKSELLAESLSNYDSNHTIHEDDADESYLWQQRRQKSISSNESLNENHEFNQYFMNVAILISKRRKNIKHQAGACIVDSKNRIVGTGNYTHNNIKKELFSWFKDTKPKDDYLNHAEVNAVVNRTEASLDNCTMFVTSFPCIECAKLIAQSGIRKIVYIDDSCCQTLNENEIFAAKVLLQLSGVQSVKLE